MPQITLTDDSLIMPAMASAHSHAFQRALRSRTQRRATGSATFWSWRDQMYRLVERLTPEQVYAIAHFAFVELALSGVGAVGEFHYLHHAPNGAPYADRTLLADTVIQAALDAGLRITLIRTAYLRAGHGQSLAPAQHRFVDSDVEAVLRDVETLRHRHAGDARVNIGLAAHSIRGVPVEHIAELAGYARTNRLPFHMHIAEQRRELDECRAEYGRTPVALLAEHGLLSPGFTAVHATHLQTEEIAALGAAGAGVCLCRTTERDLGDGLPAVAAMVQAGVPLCVGVDSHAAPDAFDEVRAVELDERARLEMRHAALEGPALLEMATVNGYAAMGMQHAGHADELRLQRDDPALADVTGACAVDGAIFAATARAVERLTVAGRTVVTEGRHPGYGPAMAAFRRVQTALSG